MSAPAQPYDLIVIGCGPAGEKAAAQAAFFGKRTVVIDRGPLGGACVHTGTLPSKALRESALHYAGLRGLNAPGLEVRIRADVHVHDLMAHRLSVAEAEVRRIRDNLDRHGIRLVRGAARLRDANTVEVALVDGGTETLRGSHVIVATGTRPRRPAGLPFESDEVWDSDQILDMRSIPESMLVYGAGVIGCEYAAMFAALGVQVTLVEPRDAILPYVDQEIVDTLLAAFRDLGMTIVTGAPYTAVRGEAGVGVELTLEGGAVVEAERLLFSAGRTPNSDELGLEQLGVRLNRRGHIEVDDCYRTAVRNIYAVGDVVGFPALASTGMEQGRVAACHAFGFTYKESLAVLLPYGIYTIPECAMVGATEQELRAAGTDYEVGRARYADNARGQLSAAPVGLLKLVFDPATRKLLGVHAVGERASELVHVGMTVMQFGGGIGAFIDAVYNFPTLGEMYKYAAYDGLGRLAKRGRDTSGAFAPMDLG